MLPRRGVSVSLLLSTGNTKKLTLISSHFLFKARLTKCLAVNTPRALPSLYIDPLEVIQANSASMIYDEEDPPGCPPVSER